MPGSDLTREQEFDAKFVPTELRASTIRGIGNPRARRLAEEKRKAFLSNNFSEGGIRGMQVAPDAGPDAASFSPSVNTNIRFHAKRPAKSGAGLSELLSGAPIPLDDLESAQEERRRVASEYSDVLDRYTKPDFWNEFAEGVDTQRNLYATGIKDALGPAAKFLPGADKPLLGRFLGEGERAPNSYYRELQGLQNESQKNRYSLINPATAGALAVDAPLLYLAPEAPGGPLAKTAGNALTMYGQSRLQGYTPGEAGTVAAVGTGIGLGVSGAMGGVNKAANRVMFGTPEAIEIAKRRAAELTALGVKVEPEYVNRLARVASRFSEKYNFIPSGFAAAFDKEMRRGGSVEQALERIRARFPAQEMNQSVTRAADAVLPPSTPNADARLQGIIDSVRASKKAESRNLFDQMGQAFTALEDPSTTGVQFHGKNYNINTPAPAAKEVVESVESKLLGPDGKPITTQVTKKVPVGRIVPRVDLSEFEKAIDPKSMPESFQIDPQIQRIYEELKGGDLNVAKMRKISAMLEERIPDAGPGNLNELLRQKLKIAVNGAAEDVAEQAGKLDISLAEGEKVAADPRKRLVDKKGRNVIQNTDRAIRRAYAQVFAPVTSDFARDEGVATGKVLRQASGADPNAVVSRFSGKNLGALQKAGPDAVATVQRELFDNAVEAARDASGRVDPATLAKSVRAIVAKNPGLYTETQIAGLNDMVTALGNSADLATPLPTGGSGVVPQPHTSGGIGIQAAALSDLADTSLANARITDKSGHVQPNAMLDPLEKAVGYGRVSVNTEKPGLERNGMASRAISQVSDAINHMMSVGKQMTSEQGAVQGGRFIPAVAAALLAGGSGLTQGATSDALGHLAVAAAATQSWPVLRAMFYDYLRTLPKQPQNYQDQVTMFLKFMNSKSVRAVLSTPTGINVMMDAMGQTLDGDKPLESEAP